MLGIALAVRFSLELCLVAIAASVPWYASQGWAALAASFLLVVMLSITWGLLLSPKRRFELGGPIRLILEAGLFCLASAALVCMHHPQLGLVLLAMASADKLALVFLERHL